MSAASEMASAIPVLAIDGPGGSGKGTVCKHIAAQLGWHLLDSGALYRLVAVAARQKGVALDDELVLQEVARDLNIRFEVLPGAELIRTWLDGVIVDPVLRAEQTGKDASVVAALPLVRAALLQKQRDFARLPGLVADGRDMGTVVFPQAVCKVFLTASVEERAKRRYKQLMEQGLSANLRDLQQELLERDRRDTERSSSPLRAADDAYVFDTTGIPLEEVVATLLERVRAVLQK